MQISINDIAIKNNEYKELDLKDIITIRKIYQNGQYCQSVQFVKIQQSSQQVRKYMGEICEIKYALKKISKKKLKQSKSFNDQYSNIYNQITALYLFNHGNIIRIYWHFQNNQHIYILMQYGGTKLWSLSNSKKVILDQQQIKNIFRQICQAVREIHFRNMIHRDLTLDNIVITSLNFHIKIIDFGFVCQQNQGRTTTIGPLESMAPQVYHRKVYNCKADIWSLGIILYELFQKQNPFIISLKKNYTQGQFCQVRDACNYEYKNITNQQIKQLINSMLCLNPQNRPSIYKILKSKWLSDPLSVQIAEDDEFSHFIKRQSNNDDNRKTKQILARQKKQSKSSDDQINDNMLSKNIDYRQSNKMDDFFFDRIITKKTINTPVRQLQLILKDLLEIRQIQTQRKKSLILNVIKKDKQIIKRKIQLIKNE